MLGKSIAELQPVFQKNHADFDFHICGEGGEFETVTLDCPLYKKRIEITEQETVVLSDSKYDPVAYLKITGV